MKKIMAIFLGLGLVMTSLTGCVNTVKQTESKNASEEGKLKVVSTIFPGYDFAKQIAGEHSEITILLPPGSESHSFEPSPQDIIKIQNADLLIYVGGESDSWVDLIIESMDQKVKTVKMMDCVVGEVDPAQHEEDHEHDHEQHHDHEEAHNHEQEHENHHKEGHDHEQHHDHEEAHNHEQEHENHHKEGHDHEQHHDHEEAHNHEHDHEYDEHVWTSPQNAIKISEKIAAVMCEVDSENAKIYKENLLAYTDKLNKLDNDFTDFFSTVENKTMIFGDRFPLRYFADAYGLEYYAAFPGCGTETEPSAATMKLLIDKVKEENISTIFHIEASNPKVAETISEATGAKIAMFHSCHNVSGKELNSGATYLSLMEQNLATLKEAMK